ncbi:MAG: glycosyltransferase family 9 protein [Bacteroidetes bacterium]|nr:glycosyltransferase family 9 protein [Bacteroidota bacterium]MCL5267570.1 glycosyltransferase family 9 protein [Bacteroidota bacterium]
MKRALVIQTAFLGDVILTLPLVQVLKKNFPDAGIDFLVIPETSDILKNHPDISEPVVFDKHHRQKSPLSLLSFGKMLRYRNYDVVLCPHRSIRSSLLSAGTGAEVRVGFDKSALKMSFTDIVPWRFGVHEIERNLSLLTPLGITAGRESPRLYPGDEEVKQADDFLARNRIALPYAVIAPGTVWETKRYPVEKISEVADRLLQRFGSVILVGGKKDIGLVKNFARIGRGVVSAVGEFPVMTSAEIIRRASLLIANDSAPVHIASAFNTPTVAVFGPTVKDFGFFPYHEKSVVVETNYLGCRPCTLHGGHRCPIGTFECMMRIEPEEVVGRGLELLENEDG